MRRWMVSLVLLALATSAGVDALAQPGGKDDKGPPEKGKGPPPFRAGKLFPPHIYEGLELTEGQKKQLGELEKEVRARLMTILTDKQKQFLEDIGPKGKGPKGKGKKGPKDKEAAEGPAARPNQPGIQWFATLESARQEAKRTGRPILLVSAAPHCAGVSGIW